MLIRYRILNFFKRNLSKDTLRFLGREVIAQENYLVKKEDGVDYTVFARKEHSVVYLDNEPGGIILGAMDTLNITLKKDRAKIVISLDGYSYHFHLTRPPGSQIPLN